jgi:hypothetical protein
MGIITLPQEDNVKRALEAKLKEYEERLAGFKETPLTNTSSIRQLDSVYKIEVVKKLLNKGEVDTDNLAKELKEKYGFLNNRYFESAFVIEDYCTTGGKNTWGGTGFSFAR